MADATNIFDEFEQQLTNLKTNFEQLTQKILPSNPSDKGWSAEDIKRTSYQPDITLYNQQIEIVSKIKAFKNSYNEITTTIDNILASDTITSADIDDLKSRVSQLETKYSELTALVNDFNVRISANTSNINTENQRAISEEQRIESKFDSEVATIKSNHSALEEKVNLDLKNATYDSNTGTWTFTKNNGEAITIDTNVEKLGLKLSYDNEKEALIFESTDGTKAEIPLTSITNSIQKVSITEDEANEGNLIVSITEGSPNAEPKTFNIPSYDFAKSVSDLLTTTINSLNVTTSKLDEEISRATLEESNIKTSITSLENKSVLDTDLTTNSSDEVETINQKKIHSETSSKATSDENGNNIATTYQTKATAKEEHDTLLNQINANKDAIGTEKQNRINDIASVNSRIDNHFEGNPSDFDEETAIELNSMKVNGVIYKGMKGDKGNAGEKGDTGLPAGFGTPTISVQTLSAGTQATAEITSSGENTSKIFEFKFGIPKGDKGDTGAKGDTGDKGDKGDTGNAGAQGNGFYRATTALTTESTTIDRSLIQPSGKTLIASDTIVDNNGLVFAITSNFSEASGNVPISYRSSIKGAKGDKGDKGETGERGLQGIQGETGPQGIQGVSANIIDAVNVDSTNIANVGTPTLTASFSGEQTARQLNLVVSNLKGEKGDKGDKGDPGDKGEKGDTGATGPQGAGLSILGSVASEDELQTQYPSGQQGQCVLVNGYLYVWDTTTSGWLNTNQKIVGPQGVAGKDGKGIKSISKTSTSGLTDTYTITYSDSSTSTFNVVNGAKGDKGDTGETGAQGNPGVGISSSAVEYQVSTSGTSIPSGVWTSTIPTLSTNQYLWTRTTFNLTNGTKTESYSVSKNGLDGAKGDTGAKGETGAQGIPGNDGVGIQSIAKQSTSGLVDTYLITLTNGTQYTFNVTNGAKGENGLTPTIQVGNVSTGASGTNASVTNSGSDTAMVLNFTIPRGATGEKGDKGDTGAQGPQGNPGEKGEKGDTGPQGSTGPKGDTGATGPAGSNGATFTPSVDASGNLSWTNNGGLANPATVNIKGPIGQTGPAGQNGEAGNLGPVPTITETEFNSPTASSPRVAMYNGELYILTE